VSCRPVSLSGHPDCMRGSILRTRPAFGCVEGDAIELPVSGTVRSLPLTLLPTLPTGLPELQGIVLLAWS
jgi:hypothetical protein